MSMSDNTKNILIGLGFGIAALSIGGMTYSCHQTRSMKRMIAGSAERIAQLSQVDIDRRLVDQMTQKAVRDQASYAARAAADKVSGEVLADMRNRVKQAINNQASSINKRVAEKIAEEMEDVSRDEIFEEVISATTEKLVDKLSDELDNEVGRIGKIYKGSAAALQ